MSSSKKVVLSIAWALCLLITAEILLQIRSQIRYGASIFNVLANETTYQFSEDLQLKLLRPGAVIEGSKAVIETNKQGLRSPDLSEKKEVGAIRVAILGASSVMGTYTRANKDIISYRLEIYLDEFFPDRRIDVINAGIAGYGLDDQRRMFENLIVPMQPDVIVWYSGFNDISGYCHKKSKSVRASLPQLQLPNWLLSIELITKNSVGLRTVAAGKKDMLNPETLDLSRYGENVKRFLDTVKSRDVAMVVATNARAFRADMPLDEQLKLSETARYYNDCFDLAGLHTVYDAHNELLANLAEGYGFPVLRLDQQVPGGKTYFGDATHFSVEGSDYVAQLLSKRLASLQLFHSDNTMDAKGYGQ